MAKIKLVQSAWTHGQISEKMNARSDIQNMLTSSASVLENFVIIQQGGITKRPGTAYIQNIANGARLIPFKNSYGNFIIMLTSTLLTIRNIDTNTLLTTQAIVFPNVNEVKYAQDDAKIVFTHTSMPPFVLEMTNSSTYTYGAVAFSIPPAYDFQTMNYDNLWFVLRHKVTTPAQPTLFAVGDQILITQYSTRAQAIADTQTVGGGAISYSLSTLDSYSGGVFVGMGSTIALIGEDIVSAGKVLTFSGQLLDNGLVAQLSDKVVISGKSVFFAQPTMSIEHGYPASCAFYQGRLWFGGFRDVPNLIVASQIDKYPIFESGTAKDSDPLNFKLSSDVTAKIKHIVATKTMVLFTDVGEFAFLSVSGGSGTITGANVNITLQTKNGTTDCKPQELDNQLFYVQAGGNVIRGTDYNYTSNSYQSTNVSILSPEVINNPSDSGVIKNLNGDDNSYLLYVNADGSIACLQSVQSQNIAGWSKWTTKGRQFKSICSINNRTFCLVYNPVSNITTLEEFSNTIFVDCQTPITLTNGAGTTSIAINNASILLNDGHLFQLNNVTPTNSFNVNDSIISGTGICGVTMSSVMTTIPYTLRNDQIGDLLFTKKKTTDLTVYFYRSIGVDITIQGKTEVIPLLKYDVSLYNAPLIPKTDIYTTDKVVDWGLLESITLSQSVPYPVTILGIGVTLHI
jgi:hypothetical protein